MPEISIIMPVYNTQQFINKSINSILRQSFSDFELILINDGSTDYTLFYCKAFAAKDRRIKVLDMPHSGVAAARLAGINAAQGRYIGFVDSDDWVEKDFLIHLYTAISCNHADIAMCRDSIEIMDKSCEIKSINRSLYMEGGVYSGKILREMKRSQLICGNDRSLSPISPQLWNKLFRRDLLLANAGYLDRRLYFGEDRLVTIACILDSRCFCVINNADYHYLQRTSSLMHQNYKSENRAMGIKIRWMLMKNMLDAKGYSDLAYKADALTVYVLSRYPGTVPDQEMMEMVLAQSEEDGCEGWRDTLRTVKTLFPLNVP